MDEFGHILREARETKGLTLTEVQGQTRINARFLDALEKGEYSVLPTPVHVRGFLRNYARFLGLSPQPLVDQYERVLEQETAVPPTSNGHESIVDDMQIPSQHEQPFFNPVNFQVATSGSRNSESILRLVIIAAFLIALGLIATRFVPMLTGDDNAALVESVNQAVQNVTDQIGPTAVPDPDATPDAAFIPTSRNNPDNTTDPVPLPTRPLLPAMESIQLKLEITERTWMEITIDDDVVFSGIAKKGDPPYEWEAQQEVIVNTGNAIAVHVTINETAWGRMGERGENKEEVWRTTN